MTYWYNVSTGQVESDEEKSRSDDLMGPYDTREDAAQALTTAASRTQAWDEEDKRWEGQED